jgi:hypothetical protein
MPILFPNSEAYPWKEFLTVKINKIMAKIKKIRYTQVKSKIGSTEAEKDFRGTGTEKDKQQRGGRVFSAASGNA